MVYHKDADHSLHMELSRDGYSWTALNNDRHIVNGDSIAQQRGIRDPHIYRAPDGTFYVPATDLHVFGKRDGKRDTEWERDGEKFLSVSSISHENITRRKYGKHRKSNIIFYLIIVIFSVIEGINHSKITNLCNKYTRYTYVFTTFFNCFHRRSNKVYTLIRHIHRHIHLDNFLIINRI